jgi:hypothetical protein
MVTTVTEGKSVPQISYAYTQLETGPHRRRVGDENTEIRHKTLQLPGFSEF